MGERDTGWSVIKTVLLVSVLVMHSATVCAGEAKSELSAQAQYELQVSEGEVFADIEYQFHLHGDGPATISLIPLSLSLRSLKSSSDSVNVTRGPNNYQAHLRKTGKYEIRLSCQLPVQPRKGIQSFTLPLVQTANCEVNFTVDRPGMVIRSHPAVPMKTDRGEKSSSALLYPAGLDSLDISWQPRSDIRREPVFETREYSVFNLSQEGLRRHTALSVNMRRGKINHLEVAIPPGVNVLGLSGVRPLRKKSAQRPIRPLIESWRLVGEADKQKLVVKFRKAIANTGFLRILSEQVASQPTGEIILRPFKATDANRRRGRFSILDVPGHTMNIAGTKGMQRTETGGPRNLSRHLQSVVPSRPDIALAFQYHQLPASVRIRLTELSPQISASILTFSRLQAGLIDIQSKVSCRIEKRATDLVQLELDEGLLILNVTGADVAGWGVQKGKLRVRLREPVRGTCSFTVTGVQHLRRINGVFIPRLRVSNANRQTGYVGVSSTADLGLVHRHAAGYRQVEPSSVPPWLRKKHPELTYRYETTGQKDDRELTVSTKDIKPKLVVQGQGVAIIGEETVEEEYIFTCDVSQQQLLRLIIQVPEGLNPINLFGDQVTDWEFHPESRLITVDFDQGLRGKTRLHLFGQRMRQGKQRIQTGGVTVRGAEHSTGTFGVGTNVNLKVMADQTRGVTPVDVRSSPPLISTHDDVNLGFKWRGQDWNVTCETSRVQPLINATTRTALLVGAGVLNVRTNIKWDIQRASVDKLKVALPAGATPKEVEGSRIQNSNFSDGSWTIRLANAISGSYELSVKYETVIPTSERSVSFPGVKLPQADQQNGTLALYLRDPRLEVSVSRLDNMRRTPQAPSLAVQNLSPLDTFSYNEPDRQIRFTTKGHALAAGVQLQAKQVNLETVVKREGRAISYMECRVENAGEQYFSFQLPEGALLWGTYVEQEPVRPIRQKNNGVAIPLLEAPRGKPFTLAVIWSQPSPDLGLGSSLNLGAPRWDLPTEKVHWNLRLPGDYQIIRNGGNMKLMRQTKWYDRGLPAMVIDYVGAAWPLMRRLLKIGLAIGTAVVLIALLVMLGRLFYAWLKRRMHPVQPGVSPVRIYQIVCFILVLVLIGAFIVSMTMPALSRARPEALETSAINNLKQIGTAITMFQNEHDGRMPPDLQTLVREGYLDSEELLTTPVSNEPYLYRGPITSDEASPDTPIAWGRVKDGGGVVLFYDMHAEYADKSMFGSGTRKLAGQSTDIETAGGKHAEHVKDLSEAFGVNAETDDSGKKRKNYQHPAEKEEKALQVAEDEEQLSTGGMDAESVDLRGMSLKKKRQQKGYGEQKREVKGVAGAVTGYAPEGDAEKEKMRRRLKRKTEKQRDELHSQTLQMAESYRQRGKLDKAEQKYRQALSARPGSQKAQQGLKRVQNLQNKDDAGAGPREVHPSERKAVPFTRKVEQSFSLRSLLLYRNKLREDLGEDWSDSLAETPAEAHILSIIAGDRTSAELSNDVKVHRKDTSLVAAGPRPEVRQVGTLLSKLESRALQQTRDITRRKKKLAAERAVQRRIKARRRQAAAEASAQGAAGTVSGSRGAGTLPIEIAFPGFGTEKYPFSMPYAGTSQARVEITCLRSGATMVLQGAVIGVVWLVICLCAWKSLRTGLVVWLLLALTCALFVKIGTGATTQYVAMALVGIAFAIPLLLIQFIRRTYIPNHQT